MVSGTGRCDLALANASGGDWVATAELSGGQQQRVALLLLKRGVEPHHGRKLARAAEVPNDVLTAITELGATGRNERATQGATR